MRSWRPAGLIVIPCDGAFKSRLPVGFSIPTILADRIPDDPGFDLVAVDNGSAAGAVARHLDRNGYENCIVVGSTLRSAMYGSVGKGRGPMPGGCS